MQDIKLPILAYISRHVVVYTYAEKQNGSILQCDLSEEK